MKTTNRRHSFNFIVLFACLLIIPWQCYAEKILYPLTNEPIDVVIPCTDKDLETLQLCIDGIRRNGINTRRIIVVSKRRLTQKAEWFDESKYPFSKEDVTRALCQEDPEKAQSLRNNRINRIGWYYQQLLKLYAPLVIPDISSNVLVLDSDTIFLRPVAFLNEQYGAAFNPGKEYHLPYFEHIRKLIPWLTRLDPKQSGVTHHMLFQKPIIEDIFQEIETLHQEEAWRAFCHCVDPAHTTYPGASEFEIYFNFSLSRSDQLSIRPLKWANIRNLKLIPKYKKEGYHYVSCHSYSRKK